MPSKHGYPDSMRKLLIDIYGGNLTSDSEPEEMLFQKRKAIMAHYSRAYQLKNDEDEKWAFAGEEIEEVLYNLFGDKCLPDKAEEIADKCTEPIKEHFEKGQPMPKFKVGELAMNYGRVCRVLEYNTNNEFPYLIHILYNNNKTVVHESDLEPYTEEPETNRKETQNLSRSDEQSTENKEPMEEKEQCGLDADFKRMNDILDKMQKTIAKICDSYGKMCVAVDKLKRL